MKALNLGCGPRIHPKPWVNADILEVAGVDIVMDMNNKWPWEDNTFDQFFACQVAEHCKDKLHFIMEMWRVCKCGAFCEIQVPNYTTPAMWTDPTHYTQWNIDSFRHFIVGDSMHDCQFIRAIGNPGFELVYQDLTSINDPEDTLDWGLTVIKQGMPKVAEPGKSWRVFYVSNIKKEMN